MYRNNDLEVQQTQTILTEVTLDFGAMSCSIRGYLRSVDGRYSCLEGSLRFPRNDRDHVTDYRTQYHSLNMYSRGNLKSYSVICFVILIKACGIANSTDGRHIRCFVVAGWRGVWHNSSSLLPNVRQWTANHYSCLVGIMFSETVLSAIEWIS